MNGHNVQELLYDCSTTFLRNSLSIASISSDIFSLIIILLFEQVLMYHQYQTNTIILDWFWVTTRKEQNATMINSRRLFLIQNSEKPSWFYFVYLLKKNKEAAVDID
jgi:hypothetical protein